MRLLKRILSRRMATSSTATPPKPLVCCGRNELRDRLIASATDCACVLLFGGRQSGKTTVLRSIEHDLLGKRLSSIPGHRISIPVYVDLMRLPYDATPIEFFRLVWERAGEAWLSWSGEVRTAGLEDRTDCTDMEDFRELIIGVRQSSGQDLQFVFLLDEAKRVLSTRFPRGFQDNLFSLMFGSAAGPYSFVLAGAQELYRLCEDSTSPIGSRARKHSVVNLSREAVAEIGRVFDFECEEEKLQERAELIYFQTAGHAGLSADLAKRFALQPEATVATLENIIQSVRSERSELVQTWIHSLSPEARTVSETLMGTDGMTISEIAACLRASALAPYRADRVSDELQFTGIAIMEGDLLVSLNRIYVETARRYAIIESGTERDREVWDLIRDAEIGLRRLIRREFELKWPGSADAQMRTILGDQTWASLSGIRAKSEKSYGNTPRSLAEILDCAYLGQLGELIKSNSSWALFQYMFRDKRELEDLLKDVTPVRNDCAHFRTVPDREMDRCRLRCEDLLVIISKQPPAAPDGSGNSRGAK